MSKIYDLTHEEWVVLDHGIRNIKSMASRMLDTRDGVDYCFAAHEIKDQVETMEQTLQRPVMTPLPPKVEEKPKPAKWNPFKK